MATVQKEWLSATEAAEKYELSAKLLRRLVRKGVFTRGNFGAAVVRPPIYLRVAELDAYRSGGVTAVAPVKNAYLPPVSPTTSA